MIIKSKLGNPHGHKDEVKASLAGKFIGVGTLKSSTRYYANQWPADLVNCGTYVRGDVVFVSVEGNRPNRLKVDELEVAEAARAGVAFITDNPANRKRPYNLGERELAAYLEQLGYSEKVHALYSVWKPTRRVQLGN